MHRGHHSLQRRVGRPGPHCCADQHAQSVLATPTRLEADQPDDAQDDLDVGSERLVALRAFGNSAQNMVRAISGVFGTQSWRA